MKDWSGTTASRRRKKRFGKKIKWDRATLVRKLSVIVLIGTLAGVFLMFILFAWFAKDLPNPNTVVRRTGFSTKILDRDGNLLHDLYDDVNRVPVKLEEVPIELQQATIAVEDKEFYEHEGFSVWGMIRGFSRLFTRGRAQGGSTLTQQTVKNTLLSSERTLARKFKELVLSIQIERKFTKDEILQMYLNEAPYGGTAWGIAAASQKYFGKDPLELDLVQSAILAGLPQSPTRYSPYGTSPDAYIGRTQVVLRRMKEDGYITEEQEGEALEQLEKIEFKEQSGDIKAAHFVFYVREQIEELLGYGAVEQGGLIVSTTLDGELQDLAQEIVTEEIAKIESLHITNGAAMAMDPQTGEILAMVGSKDFFAENYDGQVNVVMSLRQPGSAIKPVTYATAFKKGYPPSTMLMDVPTKFPGGVDTEFYEPKNYDGEFRGPVQLRFALGSSLNVPAVKLLALVGVESMLQTAYDMGFDSLEPTRANMNRFGLSVTLGGGEVRLFDMVRSYSVFANGGERVEPVSILKIKRDGKTIYEPKKSKNKRVLGEDVAFLINHILYDNNARLLTFGSNSYLNMAGRPIAVKTGTTNDQRDNWTVGWSSGVVVGVWVGNNDNTPMKQVASGVTGASPIWRRIMLEAFGKYGGDDFVPPSNVEAQQVDTVSGYPAHDDFPSRADYFIKGTLPTEPDPIHAKLKLCRNESKLATPIDVEHGEYDEKEYFVLEGYDPYEGLWQEGIQEWLATVGDERYHPPTEYCHSSSSGLVVQFQEPSDKQRFDDETVNIRIKVTSNDLKFLKLQVDGVTEKEFTSKDVETTITRPKGSYELRAWAENNDGSGAETTVRIGIGQDWNADLISPMPSPTP